MCIRDSFRPRPRFVPGAERVDNRTIASPRRRSRAPTTHRPHGRSTSTVIGFICGKRSKWVVLVVWVVIMGLAGGASTKLMSVEKNDAISFLPPNAQSTQVQNLAARFPGGQTQLATVVYHREGGLTAADLATIASDRQRIDASPDKAAGEQPARVPVVSPDRATAYFSVPLSSSVDINATTDGVNHLRAVVGEGSGGLDVKVTGQAASLVDSVGAFKGLDGTLLIAAGLLVAVLLLIIYRSPFLWLLPLLAVGFAYQAAEALIYELARHGLTVNGQSGGILTVLIFGVGTDYALLIVARYRAELVRHEDRHEAMAAALRRVGPTVLASGGTVTLSLLCLLTASLNSDKGLGPVCAIGVVVVVFAMLTALPMLLLIVGRGVFWPFVPRYDASVEANHAVTQKRLWVWLGGLITGRARPFSSTASPRAPPRPCSSWCRPTALPRRSRSPAASRASPRLLLPRSPADWPRWWPSARRPTRRLPPTPPSTTCGDSWRRRSGPAHWSVGPAQPTSTCARQRCTTRR